MARDRLRNDQFLWSGHVQPAEIGLWMGKPQEGSGGDTGENPSGTVLSGKTVAPEGSTRSKLIET